MTSALDRPRWADDGILADRVRSELGTLAKHLDQPRLHVSSAGSVVVLHGEVTDDEARVTLEHAAASVAGVSRVESHLRVGLGPGDSTPSTGRRACSSALMRRLLRAARDAGFVTRAESVYAVRALLSVVAAEMPEEARRRFVGHLPADVRHFAESGPRLAGPQGADAERELVHLVAAAAQIDQPRAERLAGAVLPILEQQGWPRGVKTPFRSAIDATRSRSAHITNMRVSTAMSRDLVTINENATLLDAFEIMTHARIHHLPVVRTDGRCVAVLDAATVARHLPEAWVSRTPPPLHAVGAVGPASVLPDESLGRAARSMRDAGTDVCCVVDAHGKLVGVLTASDIVAVVAGRHGRH